ncbi:MAG: isocitrate/isopropylmalate dehydrogenase family protein [Candidatus Odinarchaeia archaeon]
MTTYHIMVIVGDGIGPDIVPATVDVLNATGINFEFEYYDAGDETLAKTGKALPDETLEAARKSEVILKGPIGESAKEVVLPLRQELNLYANLRPAKNLPGVETRLRPGETVDLMMVRENTEGLYARIETLKEDFSFNVRLITKYATERIMKLACELALKRRRKVTVVSKANVLISDVFFRNVCFKVAEKYPELTVESMYVDNCAYQLIRDPGQFDVIVLENMFGDILSDLSSWVQGGLGLSPGANIGDNQGMFEPVHGAAFGKKGKNLGNPTAMILSAKMMLEWLGDRYNDKKLIDAAQKIEKAIYNTLLKGYKTVELGGNLSTTEYTAKVIEELNKLYETQ